MARSTKDAALMLSVLAGPDDRDPLSLPDQNHELRVSEGQRIDLKGRRIAYAGDLNGLVPQSREVRKICEGAARRFEDLGCEVSEDSFDASSLTEILVGTRGFGMIGNYIERYEKSGDVMTPPMVNQIEASLGLNLRTVTKAERLRGAYWEGLRKFQEKYDYIITPTVGVPPFNLFEPIPTMIDNEPVARFYDAYLTNYAFSVAGLPIISVPSGFYKRRAAGGNSDRRTTPPGYFRY